ncbi:SET domain-containing protein [Stipitochalara longipes BDJ]|nr:SET domain-containing protein [Stipitochalara longipes BDJ]
MHREKLPITALPAWSKLNDVNFLDSKVEDLGGSKGFGLVTERALNSKDIFDIPTLVTVPRELVLSAEAVEEHAKADQHFRQLLDATGGKSLRGDVLLFLLMQITIGSPNRKNVGLSTAWTAYVNMLPDLVPVPTIWSEEERILLLGTSLEVAVNAKLATLLREFEVLREQTATIPWCKKSWWDDEALEFGDWVLVDAWYRSRSLELPNNIGECMVPVLDMVNHSSQPNAYYEHIPSSGVSLLMRPDKMLEIGSEITISYGTSKSEAEMLFSYGFIDEKSTNKSLVLTIDPFPDDPLGKAKVAAFEGQPLLRVYADRDKIKWECPFLYLMLLNEEDGLEFRVLQQTDGSRSQLKVFWKGSDVSDATNTFEALTSEHHLSDVFKLRATALFQDRIRQQLERLYESEDEVDLLADTPFVRLDRRSSAILLRKSERLMLEKAFAAADAQKNELLESEVVLRYLGSTDGDEEPGDEETNSDDFA